MPFSDMPADELIVRSLPLAFMVVSGVFCACSALAGRSRRRRGLSAPGVYPGSREQAGDLNLGWWRSLSKQSQELHDEAALDAAEKDETGTVRKPYERLRQHPDPRMDAEESARYTASRMAEAAQRNALFHP